MARPNKTQEHVDEETGEVTVMVMSDRGAIMPATFDDLVNAKGSSIVKTIKIGDPQNGGLVGYVGALVGPGEPVKTELEVPGAGGVTVKIPGELPTWVLRPVDLKRQDNGDLDWNVVGNVTHVVICPHQLQAAFTRIFKQAAADGKVGKVAVRWEGKKGIKGGRQQINDYSVVERYDALPEAAAV